MPPDTCAIVVAGGKGLRFGAGLPAGRAVVRKQYLPLKNKPLLWWSLAAFEKSPSVHMIILVLPLEDVTPMTALHTRWGFKKLRAIVPGGKTRADSVRAGLAVVPRESRYVAVHDAVRPLVQPRLIEAVIAAARATKAALAACPSKDTVKIAGSRNFVKASPARDTVWLAHTPQVFEKKLLEKAHDRAPGANITDDSMLVERLGIRVKLVQSPPENIKVTVPMDYVLARRILEDRS